MRSIASRLKVTWTDNGRYTHGRHSKARWKLETEVTAGMKRLPGIVLATRQMGRWRLGRVQRSMDQLQASHPCYWALQIPGKGLYLPKSAHAAARAWLRLLWSLQAVIQRIASLRQAWGNFRWANDPRDGHREVPKRQKTDPTSLRTLLQGSITASGTA